jgi:hypothetical protein
MAKKVSRPKKRDFRPGLRILCAFKKSGLNFLREKMNERGKELIFTAGG